MPVTHDLRLRVGDAVEVDLDGGASRLAPRRVVPARPALPPVLHEDDRLLVFDKPAGLYTVPDRHGRDPGLHGLLPEARPEEDLRIVHRLDLDTSGCLAVAKGLESARFLDRAFREGRIAKEYLALVEGCVHRDAFDVRRHLGPDRRQRGLVVVVAEGSKGSRAAHTRVEVIERFTTHTLVRLLPTTGRGHQLRVHMHSTGHPIAGDGSYGGEPVFLSRFKSNYKLRPGVEERPLLRRSFLHAVALSLPVMDDPEAAPVQVTAPLPADLEAVLVKLRRFGGSGRAR